MWEFHISSDFGEFGDKFMETIVLIETDEVVKTNIKVLTSFALRKRLFHLFFILFFDLDSYDIELHQFYTIISTRNLGTNKITAEIAPWNPAKNSNVNISY
jgi:hypothetical protein